MATFKLRIIDEDAAKSRIRFGIKTRYEKVLHANGEDTYLCGCCNHPLLTGMGGGFTVDKSIVFACYCGALNEIP